MTICIAATCQSDNSSPELVFVLDTAISLGGMTSVETGVKGSQIGDTWHSMFAGDDVSHVGEVILRACGDILSSKDESIKNVRTCVSNAYQKVRKERVEEIFLSPLGWNLEQFIMNGKKLLPVSDYSRLLNEIQRYDLGCELIVGGFDPNWKTGALIFHVVNPGTVIPNDAFGFAAIGSGATAAYAYLARREQYRGFSLAQTIYNAIGAKIFAEKAIGIGKETIAIVLKRDGSHKMLNPTTIGVIRKMWEDEEDAIRPPNLEKRITDLLGS
jgi:hypothetical protein